MPQGQQNQNIEEKQYYNKLNKNLKKKRMIIPLTVIISPVH